MKFNAKRSDWFSQPELDRLDLTHQMIMEVMEGKLHLCPLDKDKPLRILDIGTGTGIWAIQMGAWPHFLIVTHPLRRVQRTKYEPPGDQYPLSEIIGTDLSPTQPIWWDQPWGSFCELTMKLTTSIQGPSQCQIRSRRLRRTMDICKAFWLCPHPVHGLFHPILGNFGAPELCKHSSRWLVWVSRLWSHLLLSGWKHVRGFPGCQMDPDAIKCLQNFRAGTMPRPKTGRLASGRRVWECEVKQVRCAHWALAKG